LFRRSVIKATLIKATEFTPEALFLTT
jgi:hypothetical protein